MKKFIAIICFAVVSVSMYAQKQFTIDNENLELFTAVEGDITLLWNTIDGKYRYFVVKKDKTYELTNTRGGEKNKFQSEYKEILNNITPETGFPTDNVKLTLGSLKKYVNSHNASLDRTYEPKVDTVNAQVRLGLFGGVTNAIYSPNPDNETTSVAGLELEFFSSKKLNRHSIFTQLRHVFEKDSYQFTHTGLSINYRFKIINSEWFHFYAEAELVEVYYYEEPRYINNLETGVATEEESINDFGMDLPISFGVGMAIKIAEGSYLTLSYNDFVALGIDDNGEFPIDFTAGLKFDL
ncbi:hypothetical protein SAMN04488096_101544 [Mesonia phycicola]|uniref:Outer membrane protein beta-barrel domain-containing protein n=1 Tax=Mesonia phycicola TaxID=579105 RepID=A0A1M6B1B1_9FLAO|nr:hypothetical protein [Mesonia phycicola]SHI42388.1 hypothetical protein SAMN04488096_101544 [Mesonia phycicola]